MRPDVIIRVGDSSSDALGETQAPDERSGDGESIESADSVLRAVAALPASEAEPNRIGTQIAHYRVKNRLGQGGMGVVYLAEDTRLHRDVALKVLPQRMMSHDERRQRFLREARFASAVQAPNVGTVFDVGESDGAVWIAMELVRGKTLRAILDSEGGALEYGRALDIACQMARGLGSAHASGVIHRDIKPENIMVTDDGLVKVIDFGLAKVDKREEQPSSSPPHDGDLVGSRVGRVMGTAAYMSPEQARGEVVDARTDVWALGVVLREMFTGAKPLGDRLGKARSTRLPRDLAATLDRCLSTSPGARFGSGGEVHEALTRVKRGSRSGAGYVGAAVLVVAGIAVALPVVVTGRGQQGASESSAPSAVSGPPLSGGAEVVSYLNEPAPSTSSPEALALFRRARSLQRDADWTGAAALLREAIDLDPRFGEACLVLAFSEYTDNQAILPSSRELYRRAVDERARMGERWRRFLAALEPLLSRDPPDPRRALELFDRLVADFPDDVPLMFARSNLYYDINDAVPVADIERMLELDPNYADAWQWLIWARMEAGRFDEAEEAVEHCHQLAPNSKECSLDALALFDAMGWCESAAEEGRRAVGVRAKIAYPAILLGLGRPRESVLDAYASVWDACSLPRSFTEPLDRGLTLAAFDGDFVGALENTQLALQVARQERLPESHHWQALKAAVLAAEEAGSLSVVAPQVRSVLASQAEWASKESYLTDGSLGVWRALRTNGHASAAELEEARARFQRRWAVELAEHPTRGWSAVYGATVETGAEARVALDAAPSVLDATELISFPSLTVDVGKILLRAGRPDDAIPWLRTLGQTCSAWSTPYELMRAHVLLGEAYASAGEVERACVAYSFVLTRWGAARPRSRTAEQVRAQVRRLGCKR